MKIFAALVLVAAVGAVVAPNRQPCNAPPWGADEESDGGCGHRVRVVTRSGKRQDRVRQVDQVRLIV